MDEQSSPVIEMLKQMQVNMNSRFDRIEENHENIRKQVTDIDREAVRRHEFTETFKGMLDEFSKMTERLEGEVKEIAGMKPMMQSIVPRSEQEARWKLQEQIQNQLRKDIKAVRDMVTSDDRRGEQRKREKRQLLYSILAGICSSGVVVILTNIFAHVKW